MLDYIIVGCGLGGIAFSETALQKGKRIFVVNNKSQNSTKIAGGLYNPVILKRFSEGMLRNNLSFYILFTKILK